MSPAGRSPGPSDASSSDDQDVPAHSKEIQVSGTSQRGTTAQPTDRQQRANARSSRMLMVREARKATSRMEPPEPRYGLYLAAALIGAAMLSLFSKDVEQVKNLHGSGTHYVAVAHAQVVTSVTGAVALALISAITIYWRKRLVTMVAFMLTSVFSLTLPLPQNLLDLRYVIYLAPLAYALWLYFRQNKAQKILLAKEAAASGRASAPTSTSARQRTQETRRVAAPKPQGKQSKGKQVVPTTGRPLPANNRRYTRPQAKGRSGQRKR